MQPTLTSTPTKFENPKPPVFEHYEIRQLTGVQEYAIDLYERGFNVFPIPSAFDWKLRGTAKKTPYKLEPLFRNRMHYAEGCVCNVCMEYNFLTLFESSNIAIMCGATSGNLFAIDCDSAKALQSMGQELKRRALPFWAFTSHRGGAYLLRAYEGELANVPDSHFDDVQIWGHRHFVVVPPSIHPKGTCYQWLSPEPLNMLPYETLQVVSIDDLQWLGARLRSSRKEENEDLSQLPEYAKQLSDISCRTLLHGAKQGLRNTALTALAADLAGIGLDEDEARSALQMAAFRCTPVYNDRDHQIEPILRWAYQKERKPSRKYQPKTGNDVQDWQRAEIFEASFDWRGTFGHKAAYAQRVFNFCIERARLDCRSKVFRVAVREVVIPAQMHKDTVSRYLRLLIEHGILFLAGTEASGAYLYRFGDRIKAGQDFPIDLLLSENCPSKSNTLPTKDIERDAFHKLGRYAYAVWRELLVRPAASYYQLAQRLKLHKDTVKATVGRLTDVGLAGFSPAEGVYHGNAMTEAQLERLALDLGTYKKTQAKRAQFRRDREKYVNRVIGKAKDHYKSESARLSQVAKYGSIN